MGENNMEWSGRYLHPDNYFNRILELIKENGEKINYCKQRTSLAAHQLPVFDPILDLAKKDSKVG